MLAHVCLAFAMSNGTYGSTRMMCELQDVGLVTVRRRTARLMRENGLRGRQKRRLKRTIESEHAWPIAPNIIDQEFLATAPNQKWSADISYVWARERWLLSGGGHRPLLAPCRRLGRRRPAARDLALVALHKVLVVRRPPKGSFIIQTAAANTAPWTNKPRCAVTASLSSCQPKEAANDNAMVETFFKTIKSELVWRRVFDTRAEAATAIARYIDGFCNPVRRHSALDHINPAQFERAELR